ncbi:MAG: TetR/AcrR family transcriptional regulator [Rhodospirillaceae bacterium]|nr:TetR/AcrR family transcriptional regulator [Rhodospirillaceae bacterium]
MSKSSLPKRAPKKRPYEQKLRAEQAAETRQRIVEAALHLHGTIGPARTTVSMIADRAGVQRHTFYAHFPDETDLFLACSGLHQEQDPMPDAEGWRAVADPKARLMKGLGALYDWYGRNARLVAAVLRDAEHHPVTAETIAHRITPHLNRMAEILSDGIPARQRPLLHLAMSFHTWRSLVQESDLSHRSALTTMSRAIFGE